MFDALTSTFRLSCPRHGQTSVRLSRFRRLDELPGPHHPAVFRVVFACGCGEEHPALVAHDELDLGPLGLEDERPFLDLMTSRTHAVALELAELAAQRIKAGQWPWSFFCWPEDRPRPVFPSAFRLLAESGPGGRVAVAVRCPACGRVSLNLVTREHIDLPFVNDREIGVVGHLFDADAAATLDAFTAELYSESFDARRLTLE
ncbi:MAG TPA: hypothetical protein VFB42_07460 [Gaiellaceae bacterium]|nr:hypothetical protein [Gaiellaceae bacterium]